MGKYKFLLVVVIMLVVGAYVSLTPKQTIAPDFVLPHYPDGQSLQLSDVEGRAVLLNFWASWCLVCRKEKQLLDELRQTYPDLLVLEVLTHDDGADLQGFARPFLYDKDNQVASLYQVSSLPQTFLIDKQKHIRWHSYNPIDTSINDQIKLLLD